MTSTQQKLATTNASKQGFTPPRWLVSHSPAHPVDATKVDVQNAIAAARRSLEVVDPQHLAIILYETLSVFTLPENWEMQSDLYVGALEDLPPDLVREGLGHTVKHYRFKFPKPADIRAPIEDEFTRRRAHVTRLETILKAGRFKEEPRRKPTQAEIDKVAALVRGLTEGMKA